jgi:hypothetical protein
MEFWKGVWFTRTSRFPEGRLIFAAIFPLIGDLPAICKTAGFASHSATKFCSLCEITLQDINVIDPQKFIRKTHEEHMERVKRWEASTSFHAREDIGKKEGARASILNQLPYWRPVDHCGIEVMHAHLLGNLKDHSYTFLSVYEAGKDLKKLVELETKWKKTHSGKHIFRGLKFPQVKRKRTPEEDSSGTEEEDAGGGKRRLLSSKNLSRLSRIEEDIGPSTLKSSLQVPSLRRGSRSASRSATTSDISQDTASSDSTVHRYQLRPRSARTESSLGSGSEVEADRREIEEREKEYKTEMEEEKIGDTGGNPTNKPRLTKEELRVLQDVIAQTTVPTWISRVPHNFGSAGAGSLKAADWLILYTVYYPLAIVPLWVIGDGGHKQKIENSIAVTHQDVLRDSLIKLIEITNILMKHHLNSTDLANFTKLIKEYRNILRIGWPTQESKANLHLTQHYPQVIKGLGPPMATSAWAQERINGILGKIPNNHHLGM